MEAQSDSYGIKTEQIRRINTASALVKEEINKIRDELIRLVLKLGTKIDEQLELIQALFEIELQSMRAAAEGLLRVEAKEREENKMADMSGRVNLGYSKEKIERIVRIREVASRFNKVVDEIRRGLVALVMDGPLKEEEVKLAETYFELDTGSFQRSANRFASLG